MQPSLDALVAALPTEVATPLRAALTLDGQERTAALVRAFEAASVPKGAVFPLANTLTPTQRLLAELPLHGVRTPGRFALPRLPHTTRGYLGIDPPGPAERVVERGGTRLPLWRAMQDCGEDEVAAGALLAPLTALDAAQAFVALARSAYMFPADGVLAYGKTDFLSRLGPEAAEWARATAADWLGTRSTDAEHEKEIELVLAVALARSGVPEDALFDRLLPATFRSPTEYVRERLRSIPSARRLSAALAALARPELPHVTITHGLAMLEELDSPEIVRIVMAASATTDTPKQSVVKSALGALAARQPNVASALGSASRAAPPSVQLRLVAIRKPKRVAELSTVEREQLRLSGVAWDGADLPAPRRLGGTEEAFGGVLEQRTLADADGALRYDAWLYGGDSGSYFAAGTATIVGSMLQGSVQLSAPGADAALRDALQQASEAAAAGPPARPAARPRAAKKAKTPAAPKPKKAKTPAAPKPKKKR